MAILEVDSSFNTRIKSIINIIIFSLLSIVMFGFILLMTNANNIYDNNVIILSNLLILIPIYLLLIVYYFRSTISNTLYITMFILVACIIFSIILSLPRKDPNSDELFVSGSYSTTSPNDYSMSVSMLNNKYDEISNISDNLIMKNSMIKSMVVYREEVYVGGWYHVARDPIGSETDPGNNKFQYVAKLNTEDNKFQQITGGDLNPGVVYSIGIGWVSANNTIETMIVYNDELYIGGIYIRGLLINTIYIAKLNTETNEFNKVFDAKDIYPNIQSYINSMAIYKNELYITGYKDESSLGQFENRIYVAKLNTEGNTFVELDYTEIPSTYTELFSIIEFDNDLYVGGVIGGAENIFEQYIAKYDFENKKFIRITNGLKIGKKDTGLPPTTAIKTLFVYQDELYAGGHFYNTEDNKYSHYVGKYNSEEDKFYQITEGLDSKAVTYVSGNSINCMQTYNEKLYIGGQYKEGDNIIQYVGKYNSETNSFKDIDGLYFSKGNSDPKLTSIHAMCTYENLNFMQGHKNTASYLSLGLGIPLLVIIIGLIIYISIKKFKRSK